MKIYKAKDIGFCFGVKRAMELTLADHPFPIVTYGKIIHNERVIKQLEGKGIYSISNADECRCGTMVVQAHGAPWQAIESASKRNINIVDATCPYVKKTQNIVSKYHKQGYKIAIIGKAEHPEIVGINSYADYSAIIIDSEDDAELLLQYEKVCVVVQTTYSVEKFSILVEKIRKFTVKTVEIFDTICYTTNDRQVQAEVLAKRCDTMLVIGSQSSSNTLKLYEVCCRFCADTYLIDNVEELRKYNIFASSTIGVVTGASTPNESIAEVFNYMSENFTKATDGEFLNAMSELEDKTRGLKAGRKIQVTVASANEKGILVNCGEKVDGLVPANEASLEGEYNPSDYTAGMELEVMVVSPKPEDGCFILSKKRIDLIKEGDKVVDTIRNGEIFTLMAERVAKGGLIGKLGTYNVFIPASQIKERYINEEELAKLAGKTLRLVALDIDNDKKRIVASQRKILHEERVAKEDTFWANVVPGVIVTGKVKRIVKFGAFVSIDDFDCLVHIGDVSWTNFKSIEDVLTINKKYDFVVLKADRETKKVSLGYKQLQKHPFEQATDLHPIGSVATAKITSILPFGLFVELQKDVEGLVHVSEASRSFVKDLNESFKVGDEVQVKTLAIDFDNKKFTLSIKACLPEEDEDTATEKRASKPRSSKKADSHDSNWSEDAAHNPFANLADLLDSQD